MTRSNLEHLTKSNTEVLEDADRIDRLVELLDSVHFDKMVLEWLSAAVEAEKLSIEFMSDEQRLEFVQAESIELRRAFSSFWINGLIVAWSYFGEREVPLSRVRLTPDFTIIEKDDVALRYVDLMVQAARNVCSALTVTMTGLMYLCESLAEVVLKKLEEVDEVELPDKVNIVMKGTIPTLVRRG